MPFVAILALFWAQDGEARNVLDRHRSLLPQAKDLVIYDLDWVAGLKEAKERAAKESRPVLLIAVTNSYGNMYTGHC